MRLSAEVRKRMILDLLAGGGAFPTSDILALDPDLAYPRWSRLLRELEHEGQIRAITGFGKSQEYRWQLGSKRISCSPRKRERVRAPKQFTSADVIAVLKQYTSLPVWAVAARVGSPEPAAYTCLRDLRRRGLVTREWRRDPTIRRYGGLYWYSLAEVAPLPTVVGVETSLFSDRSRRILALARSDDD